LKLALGELGSLMTTGQRVVPKKAIEKGYVFQHATLDSALQAIFPETAVIRQAA
jgi:NAD dependent epimerase/dehydratase family enzyme